jgi:hypothetical protein
LRGKTMFVMIYCKYPRFDPAFLFAFIKSLVWKRWIENKRHFVDPDGFWPDPDLPIRASSETRKDIIIMWHLTYLKHRYCIIYNLLSLSIFLYALLKTPKWQNCPYIIELIGNGSEILSETGTSVNFTLNGEYSSCF